LVGLEAAAEVEIVLDQKVRSANLDQWRIYGD